MDHKTSGSEASRFVEIKQRDRAAVHRTWAVGLYAVVLVKRSVAIFSKLDKKKSHFMEIVQLFAMFYHVDIVLCGRFILG